MNIEIYGNSRRLEYAARKLSQIDCPLIGIDRIILLPIPVTRDGVHLFGTDTTISDVIMRLGHGDAVVGYGISEEDAKKIEESGCILVDVSKDEIFLLENARLTALATVGYLLTESERAPNEETVGIVGYGRIGKELLNLLLPLGTSVVVYTSKDATRMTLGSCGVRSESFAERMGCKEPFFGISILINTAPTNLSTAFDGGVIPFGMRVVELASGNNFEGVLGVERLPSLPEKKYPLSASRVYFEAVMRGLGVAL